MYSTNEGILTGGKDGYVRMWNLNLQVYRPLRDEPSLSVL